MFYSVLLKCVVLWVIKRVVFFVIAMFNILCIHKVYFVL
jgi:hypothetical protein